MREVNSEREGMKSEEIKRIQLQSFQETICLQGKR